MLRRLVAKNFRCFRSVDVPLRPLTVLVGPNDSGKSAFLDCLQRLSVNLSVDDSIHWRFDPNRSVEISGDADEGSVRFGHPPNHEGWPAPFLHPTGLFCLPPHGVAMESPGYPDEKGAQPLGYDGSGVPSLLDYLLRRDQKRFFDMVDAVRKLVPGLDELGIATPKSETRRLDLVIENGLRIPAAQASSGVRLLLFFISLAFHPSPPKLILLEEPENGIHPKRLADIVRLLREVSQGVHGGNAAQVVLTTHSPYLLDHIDLETDQVLVFRRNDDGTRSAEPVDVSRLKNFLDEFMLGEVWFNEEEKGLIAQQA